MTVLERLEQWRLDNSSSRHYVIESPWKNNSNWSVCVSDIDRPIGKRWCHSVELSLEAAIESALAQWREQT